MKKIPLALAKNLARDLSDQTLSLEGFSRQLALFLEHQLPHTSSNHPAIVIANHILMVANRLSAAATDDQEALKNLITQLASLQIQAASRPVADENDIEQCHQLCATLANPQPVVSQQPASFAEFTEQDSSQRYLIKMSLVQAVQQQTISWQDLEDYFICLNDIQFSGVFTHIRAAEDDPRQYYDSSTADTLSYPLLKLPTICRDTTTAINVSERIANDHPLITSINVLLRCLNLTRQLQQTVRHIARHNYLAASQGFHHYFTALLLNVHQFQMKHQWQENPRLYDSVKCHTELKKIEQRFYREVIESLREQNLIDSKTSTEHKAARLIYQRYLSSTLAPAKAMASHLVDHLYGVTLKEYVIPVTVKTQIQCETVDRFIGRPTHILDINAEKSAKEALKAPDRRTSAQLRRHFPVVHNGNLVINTLHFPGGITEKFAYLRCASIAPLMADLTHEAQLTIAVNNIEQLKLITRAHGINRQLHLSILNTKLSAKGAVDLTANLTGMSKAKEQQEQNIIVDISREAAEATGIAHSLTPVNQLGTHRKIQADPHLMHDSIEKGNLDKKAARNLEATNIAFEAHNLGYIPALMCASGSDRTSVIAFMLTTLITQALYKKQGFVVSRQYIEGLLAHSYSTALIATNAAQGSWGLKTDSMPGNLLQDDTVKMLFSSHAKTNKKIKLAPKKSAKHKPDANGIDGMAANPLADEIPDLQDLEEIKRAAYQFATTNNTPFRKQLIALHHHIEKACPHAKDRQQAIDILSYAYAIATEIDCSDDIKRKLATAGNNLYQARTQSQHKWAVTCLIVGILLIAAGITLLTPPVAQASANLTIAIAKQAIFQRTLEAYHMQIIGGVTTFIGVSSALAASILFFKNRPSIVERAIKQTLNKALGENTECDNTYVFIGSECDDSILFEREPYNF